MTKEERKEYNRRYHESHREKVRTLHKRAYRKKKHRIYSQERWHLQRAELMGRNYELITLKDLARRDKDLCGICKTVVKPPDRSIDHIVPMSKGGDHVWSNVQLAHERCNKSRQDKPI